MKVKDLQLRLSEFDGEDNVHIIEIVKDDEIKKHNIVRIEKIKGKMQGAGVFIV